MGGLVRRGDLLDCGCGEWGMGSKTGGGEGGVGGVRWGGEFALAIREEWS